MSASSSVPSVSAIVPIGPDDALVRPMLDMFLGLRCLSEVLLVATRAAHASEQELIAELSRQFKVQWLITQASRALQQNHGAAHAVGSFFWFVHVDSRPDWRGKEPQSVFEDLNPRSAYFFDLGFYGENQQRMRINALGVWIRSHCFKMPFGDQALIVHRQAFESVGGFDTSLRYGEDHVMIWRLRQRGYSIVPIRARVRTSSRKYDQRGWWKTTWLHLKMTYIQAWPEFWKWLRGKQ